MLQVYLLVGAEDSEPFEVDLRLEMTEGDDKGAVCRYLNWRDGERIMIIIKLKMRLLLLNYWIVRK